jgi:hypothetical protein
MPAASDWRSASTANELMRLDRDQFAVEFLRRNPAYAEDYRNTQDHIASGSLAHDAGMARLARQWGLIFPACTRDARMGVSRPVAAGTFACRCRRCSGA